MGGTDESGDPALMSAAQLLRRYADASLSPVEATQAVLARIERWQPELNCFVLVDPDRALAAARASEARWRAGTPCGRLDGVPTTVKDLVITRDWPTRRGTTTDLMPSQSGENAPAVDRLLEHGAVLLGKTTTPEFGWKGTTDSPLTGITRNPWNPALTPGGSSGGAAAAAAAGLGALHIGTDGGGSIRIPAAFTGTFGLKPSGGRVPAYPPSAFGQLAHLGPIARTVADAAGMLSVLGEPDARDPESPWPAADFSGGLDAGIAGLRIAFSPTLGGRTVAPAIAASVQRAAQALADLGAHVEEAEPDLPAYDEAFDRLWHAGAAGLLGRAPAEQRERLDPGLRRVVDSGLSLSLLDYLDALKLRQQLNLRLSVFLNEWDLLLTPQMPVQPFAVGQDRPCDSGGPGWVDWTPFTYPFNMSRQPAASVPCGLDDEGLPMAFQLVGPLGADARVLRAARAYETAHPFALPAMSGASG